MVCLRYQWDLGDARVVAQVDATYMDDHYFQLKELPCWQGKSAYTLSNARLSYASADESWRVELFVNNLTDEEYRTMAFDLAGEPSVGGFWPGGKLFMVYHVGGVCPSITVGLSSVCFPRRKAGFLNEYKKRCRKIKNATATHSHNFAREVVDKFAAESKADKTAIVWVDDKGQEENGQLFKAQ